jgi:hydrogenase maturation protease
MTPIRAVRPVLILGIGNILLRDEGVGVHVIEAIQAGVARGEIRLPEDVEVYDGGTFGIDLIDMIAGRRKVICVDAVAAASVHLAPDDSPGANDALPPATILRFTGADLAKKQVADMSLHQIGLLEALQMSQQLGCAPQEVVIFGIAPKAMESGLEMTPEVAALVPRVVELVLAEVFSPR